jgi:hypothetical protein
MVQSIPILAASPDGKYVAVAGSGERSIRVYTVADLLANKKDTYQALSSVGRLTHTVAFLKKTGKPPELGLLLSTEAKVNPLALSPDDLVFDVAQRTLTTDKQGWDITPAAPAGNLERQCLDVVDKKRQRRDDEGRRWRFTWRGKQGPRETKIDLGSTQRILAQVFVPPWKAPAEAATLAVATWDAGRGVGILAIYETKGGSQVRVLRSHTQPIHSLAASAEGKLLASAADDQTVCIWSMTDLDEIIGRHGTVAGLLLDLRDNELVVDARSAGLAGLMPGDVIEGLALRENEEKPRTGLSLVEFYNALWPVKPGGAVWLKVRRGKNEHTFKLAVGQAADERKPLLSLFVPEKPRAAAGWDWVAWTPAGPYDSSGPEIERFVGWRFNPARIGGAATFARLEAYKKYYEPRLLKPLLDHGNLPDALRDIKKGKKVPRPQVRIDSVGPGTGIPDAEGEYLVRSRDAQLRLTIEGPSVERGQVDSVRLQLDGREPEQFVLEGASGQTFSRTLTLPPGRGGHVVRVTVQTPDDTATHEFRVRYQPKAPQIQLVRPPQGRAVVHGKDFMLEALVMPDTPDQKIEATLNEKPVELTAAQGGRGFNVKQKLPLKPGENEFVLRAVNKNAPVAHREDETTVQTLALVHTPETSRQPIFTSVEIQVTGQAGPPITVEPGKSVTVATPEIRFLGEVTATEPLTSVNIRAGDREFKSHLSGQPEKQRFLSKITLKPGENKLVLQATAKNSDKPGETRVTVLYHPALPEFELTDPARQTVLTEDAGKGPPEVQVKGLFTAPDDRTEPFDVIIEVTNQGKPVEQHDRQTAIIKSFEKSPGGDGKPVPLGIVRLGNGPNQIRVWVRNKWHKGMPVQRDVFFRRPPRIRTLEATKPDSGPSTTVTAQVESASDLPLTKIILNDRAYDPAKFPDKKEVKGITTWQVKIENVGLASQEENSIRLVVKNQDGEHRKDTSVRGLTPKKREPKAEIEILSPETVRRAAYDLVFRVRSASPLQVEWARDGGTLQPVKLEADQNGWKARVTVQLSERVNTLRIRAVNAGGLEERELSVSYIPPPVRLLIDEPEPKSKEATIQLTGRIEWTDEAQERVVEENLEKIRLFVNGFRQESPFLQPREPVSRSTSSPLATGRFRRFKAQLILNDSENEIRVECPLPEEAGGIQTLHIECAKPQKSRTLRVLIVNVDQRKFKDQELVKQAFNALQLSEKGEGFHSKVFNNIVLYPPPGIRGPRPLSDNVTRDKVIHQLENIEGDSLPTDVVLIYWLGEEAGDDEGETFLETRFSQNLQGKEKAEAALPLKRLLEATRVAVGARVILLDVASHPSGTTPPELVRTSARTAVLRYAWARDPGPSPGLLVALENAAKTGTVSLKDLVTQAGKEKKRHLEINNLTERLADLSGLVLAPRQP